MSSTTDRAEIEALFQKLARAHADHDADAIVEVYAPDAVIFRLGATARAPRNEPRQRRSLACRLGRANPDRCARRKSYSRKATWRSYRRSTECAGAKVVKIGICGTARRCVFRR
jgi:hypothetical protein